MGQIKIEFIQWLKEMGIDKTDSELVIGADKIMAYGNPNNLEDVIDIYYDLAEKGLKEIASEIEKKNIKFTIRKTKHKINL